MTIVVRVVIVLVAAVIVIGVMRLAVRWQHPSHPPIDLGGVGPRPGVVLFTSTECSNCKEALTVVGSLGVEVREVTWELEPAVFESAGVEAVPLVAVVDAAGHTELLAAGVPRQHALRRAVRRAGLSE
ncbi:MAG: hypothetical protein BMS9Abin07_2163 [Acidimicrobiia bacterium]|nr:MAG: hypothetical protein BMS9Abin07_2163 [Acidimicrobiia bacterium]